MKQVPVILMGVGGVGRILLQQLVESREQAAARVGCRFEVIAVTDSRQWRWEPSGLHDEAILELVDVKKKRGAWGEPRPDSLDVLEQAAQAGIENALVVDVTAADGMEPVLDRALELHYGVVLANKKPLTGPWATAQRYYNHPRLRYESTVGGGQPVIATLRYLLDTSDPILRIEGQLSGTLSYICRRMDEGTRFSVALAAAKARGATEPDPRVDLSGQDVMRKIMILGRMAGWPMEEADIDVESLYPPALAHLDVNEFMVASMALDPSFRDRVNAAGAAGEVLRYVAQIENGGGSVGLKAVPVESPVANLKYVQFQTSRYKDEPLMIGGQGSVEITAAGVLGDMVGLVREGVGS